MTVWYACFFISALIFALSLFGAFSAVFRHYKKKRLLTPTNIIFVGTALAAMAFFFPIYFYSFSSTETLQTVTKSALLSVQNALRLFALDGDYLDMMECLPSDTAVTALFTFMGAILYTAAPLLTFNILLTVIKNLNSYLRYLVSIGKSAHIFSELNAKTLALASSIAAKRSFGRKKPIIVFTDVPDDGDEEHYDLLEQAKLLDAVIFKKDLEAVRFSGILLRRRLSFYLISDDEEEKLRHASAIMRDYENENTTLYIVSDSDSSAILLSAKDKPYPRVIRINDAQSLVYHYLDLHGVRLFTNAREHNGGVISAVIVGLGGYGTEMLKALLWFCQMKGFTLKINAFDAAPDAESRFCVACPEIMSMNPCSVPNEAHYALTIHSGVDAETLDFREKLEAISDATYIFVGLDSDEKNLAVSADIRAIYERIRADFKPDIEAVIKSSEIAGAVSVSYSEDEPDGAKNFKGQAYRIHTVGDLEGFYSVDTLINSPVIEAGRRVNERYCGGSPDADEGFYKFEYNFRSSIAKAMHEELRKKLTKLGYIEIPGVDKPWDDRTSEEKLAIGSVEHIRWNAYMRTEGYRYAKKRNDLAKTHPNLVPTDRLTDDDLRKDA